MVHSGFHPGVQHPTPTPTSGSLILVHCHPHLLACLRIDQGKFLTPVCESACWPTQLHLPSVCQRHFLACGAIKQWCLPSVCQLQRHFLACGGIENQITNPGFCFALHMLGWHTSYPFLLIHSFRAVAVRYTQIIPDTCRPNRLTSAYIRG